MLSLAWMIVCHHTMTMFGIRRRGEGNYVRLKRVKRYVSTDKYTLFSPMTIGDERRTTITRDNIIVNTLLPTAVIALYINERVNSTSKTKNKLETFTVHCNGIGMYNLTQQLS